MPPITEQEQLQQLREDMDRLERTMTGVSLKLDMLLVALKGNTDINPGDTGLFGKVKWLTGEVLTLKRQRERVRGYMAGGVAIGGAAVAILIYLIDHFVKK